MGLHSEDLERDSMFGIVDPEQTRVRKIADSCCENLEISFPDFRFGNYLFSDLDECKIVAFYKLDASKQVYFAFPRLLVWGKDEDLIVSSLINLIDALKLSDFSSLLVEEMRNRQIALEAIEKKEKAFFEMGFQKEVVHGWYWKSPFIEPGLVFVGTHRGYKFSVKEISEIEEKKVLIDDFIAWLSGNELTEQLSKYAFEMHNWKVKPFNVIEEEIKSLVAARNKRIAQANSKKVEIEALKRKPQTATVKAKIRELKSLLGN